MNITVANRFFASVLLFCVTTTQAQYLVPRSQIEDFDSKALGAAPNPPAPTLIPIGMLLLMDFEGWRPTAYDDPAGFCTIGYGHLISKSACKDSTLGNFSKPLSVSDGRLLLETDTQSAREAVHSLVTKPISENQFSALSSFAFNVGKKNFKNSTLLVLVNQEKHDFAAQEFNRWIKANGTILKGLKDRRSCESKLYAGTLKGTPTGPFLRDECVISGVGATPSFDVLYDIDIGEP
ncbi:MULTISPECIES: lysozyme [unclassified Achromobacter]|jgi:lysozyme|uniref:lysozyme n=1 Tax=unclassified Achromobacter TaxID=2626865 RepID=UPI0009E6C5EB|nr:MULTISPECIES: lysozyme [unclassified Achromobacter]TQJ97163.1 lysozyme [Achromobacter sp. SLBN-14]